VSRVAVLVDATGAAHAAVLPVGVEHVVVGDELVAAFEEACADRRRGSCGPRRRARRAWPVVFTAPGRLPYRQRHFAAYRIGALVLVVFALIGVIAIALLVLGLLNVHA
jgi:hypothetical protein